MFRILDATRDNPLVRNLARGMGARSTAVGRGLAPVETGIGSLVAFATQPGNVALDGTGRNSLFVEALLKHIKTPGMDMSTVLINVRRDVTRASSGRQIPWEYSALTSPLILAPLAVAEIRAAPPAELGQRIALVIGNSAYTSQSRLANPLNDAKGMGVALRKLGFSDVREHYDLGLKEMGDALKEFGDRAPEADWAVIFFAGHGMEVNGSNYLLPTDAKLVRDTHIRDETISLDRVLEKVNGARKMRLCDIGCLPGQSFCQENDPDCGRRAFDKERVGTNRT